MIKLNKILNLTIRENIIFRLRKIQDQSINSIKEYQIRLVSNQNHFQKLKRVLSLKIDFSSITDFSYLI